MAAFTSIALGAVAAASAASGIMQYSQARKQRKAATANAEKQETAAREAASLKTAKTDTGAEYILGAEDTPVSSTGVVSRRKTNRTSSVLGGVQASSVGGL